MAGSPSWKVFRPNPNGKGYEYIASTKYAEDAARLVTNEGWIVKYRHRNIVWREGIEGFCAADDFDRAATIMRNRAHNVLPSDKTA